MHEMEGEPPGIAAPHRWFVVHTALELSVDGNDLAEASAT